MRKARDSNGDVDIQDIPQEPRKVMAPSPPSKPGPLLYYVTTEKRPSVTIYGPAPVDACTDWARSEAVSRSAKLDVRESGTGSVFFRFNEKGKFA